MALQSRKKSSGVLGSSGGILGGGILGGRSLISAPLHEEKQIDDVDEEEESDVIDSLPATIFGDNASKFICNRTSK